MDKFYKKLQIANIEFAHELLEHNWGQRVIRFYIPNYYIIEVGEDMLMIVKRFFYDGMTIEQVAKRMNVPVNYIKEFWDR